MPNEITVKTFLELQEKLTQLITQKQAQIAAFDQEIKDLQEYIYQINKLVSLNSFISADSLLDTETFLQQHEDQPINGPSLSRKIFSKEDTLDAFIKFEDGTIFIRISDPQKAGLTSERYITGFVKTTLVQLKQLEKQLKPILTKIVIDNEEYIETITLENVQHLESLDVIEKGIQDLLSHSE